ESERIELVMNQRQRRAIARENAMRRNAFDFAFRKVLRFQLRPRFIKGTPLHQGLGLCKAIRQQHFMLMVEVLFMALCRNDEFERNGVGALMQKLEESVLAVRTRLTPYNRAGGTGNRLAIDRDALAIR